MNHGLLRDVRKRVDCATVRKLFELLLALDFKLDQVVEVVLSDNVRIIHSDHES